MIICRLITLAPGQPGFWKGIYTDNVAFKLTNSVLKSINLRMHVGGLVCSLANASDCVNH
jgi:hypothetical protein